MSASPAQIALEDFLKLPYLEESPAWEYVDGIALQKPMPKTRHSILQKRLLAAVDDISDDDTALPELRCTFGGRSVVPDVAVIAWDRIQINEAGEPEDDFTEAPDWTIEILSPEQKATRVIDNILHCLRHGSKLGWILDPDDYSILMFSPHQEPEVCRGARQLMVLEGIELVLTAEQVFRWLKYLVEDRQASGSSSYLNINFGSVLQLYAISAALMRDGARCPLGGRTPSRLVS